MLIRIKSINKRGIHRFMHSHKPSNEINYVAWKESQDKLLNVSKQINNIDEKIVAIEREIKQHTEHNKKVEFFGELAGIGSVCFMASHILFYLFI